MLIPITVIEDLLGQSPYILVNNFFLTLVEYWDHLTYSFDKARRKRNMLLHKVTGEFPGRLERITQPFVSVHSGGKSCQVLGDLCCLSHVVKRDLGIFLPKSFCHKVKIVSAAR